MKKITTIFICLTFLLMTGFAQNAPKSSKGDCNPVKSLVVEYTDDCKAEITWEPAAKAPASPTTVSERRSFVKKSDASTEERSRSGKSTVYNEHTAVNFENSGKGPTSPIYYKVRHAVSQDIYKATLSSFPGSKIGTHGNSIQAMEYVGGTIYAVNYTSTGNTFGKIDMTTGAWTTIKANCGFDAVSLCYNPTNGLVYVTQWGGGALGTVDLTTGNFSNVATITDGTVFMAIDNDGVAYGIINIDGDFGKINLATGVFTKITTLSFAPTQIQNLGVDRETNELYWLAHNSSSSGSTVYKINKTNGALTQVATISNRVESFAIVTDPPTPCDPISNLSHSVNNANVTLTWDAAPGSPTGYEISYDGNPLTTVTTTTYTHTNVPDGLHTYGVTAKFDGACIPFGVFVPIIVGNYCQFRIEMEDSKGDGWCDAAEDFSFIEIYHNAKKIFECTVPYDSYSATAYPVLPVGELAFVWFSGNDNDEECSFKIFNSENDIIFELSAGGIYAGKFFDYDNDCGGIFVEETFYNLYRDGEIIVEKTKNTSFTDDKFDIYKEHTWVVTVVCGETESEPVEVTKVNCDEVGVKEVKNIAFTIVPNPAKDKIEIKAENEFSKVEIVNFLGQTVLTHTNDTKITTIDVSNLNAGVYFVRIISNLGTSVQKFVKQ